MNALRIQQHVPQLIDSADTKGRKMKRISELDPQLREMIPGLFDRMEAERVAKQFNIPKPEVLEEVLRDTRACLLAMRRGPQPEAFGRRNLVVMRRAA